MAKRRAKFGNKTGTKNREILIWDYSCNLLSKRIYSEKALFQKLEKRFPENPELIQKVIEKLKHYKYIDDINNAKILKESLIKKGFGPRYIKQYLYKKGFIDNNEELNYDNSLMKKWYTKKMGNQKIGDPKTWRKMYNYLLTKGFYTEDIIEFLKGWTAYERE